MRVPNAIACVVLIAGCAAHEKAGDRAAAIGDWRRAHTEYRQAVHKAPESAQLREKLAKAKREAALGAYRKGQSCAAASNWECAVSEADYAISVDDQNVEVSTFRATAAVKLALERLQKARDLASRAEFALALDVAAKAVSLSSAAEVAAETAATRTEILRQLEAEADRLRMTKSYPKALEMYALLGANDAAKRSVHNEVQIEYRSFLETEYERHAQAGDACLAAGDWAAAESLYRAALAVRGGGRAEPLAKYSGAVARGEAALRNREFLNAAASYREAASTGMDQSGFARRQLGLVEIRPYKVRIRSVLAAATRPDGSVWVGPPNRMLTSILKVGTSAILAGSGVGALGISAANKLIDAAAKVPPDNRPTLRVEVTLADGRKLRTPAKTSVYRGIPFVQRRS